MSRDEVHINQKAFVSISLKGINVELCQLPFKYCPNEI